MAQDKKHLVQAFETHIEKLGATFRTFPWKDKDTYALWLAQSYYLVKHTTNFLCLVASKIGPDSQEMHRKVIQHLREEAGHDELAARDLKNLGYDVHQMPELPETRFLWQAQYYWIHQAGPYAHSGYSLMLEGLAVRECKQVMATLESTYGKNAATFVRVHAMEDDGHFEEGMGRLLAAPHNEGPQAIENLAQSRELYERILREVQAQAKGQARLSTSKKAA